MKKRAFCILLSIVMVVGLMPTSFAENTPESSATTQNETTTVKKAVNQGASIIQGYDSTSDSGSYDYIYYGGRDDAGIKWRVLSDQTSMDTDGLFLLMENPIADVWWIDYNPLSVAQGTTYYYTSGQGMSDPTFGHNMWGNSAARVWCRAFTEQITASTTGIGENDDMKAKPIWSASYQVHQSEYDKNYQTFTDAERAQIMLTTTTTEKSEKVSASGISYKLNDYGLKGDYMFFLSANEATDAKYGLDKEVNRRTPQTGYSSTVWYTRSYAWFPTSQEGSGDVYDLYLGTVSQGKSSGGKLLGLNLYYIPYKNAEQNEAVYKCGNARPGMNLSKENVALTSAADGTAQKSFGLADDYTGNEWKLTLQTSDSFDATLSSNSLTDGGITVTHPALDSYSGAYSYDVVTAALTDENDAIVAYGSLSTNDTTSTLPLPEGIADGEYTLTLRAEKWNDEYETNYATEAYVGKVQVGSSAVTVDFDANGHGTAPSSQTVEQGQKLTDPGDLEEEGYEFSGWFTERECQNKWTFETDTVDKAMTLYAKWTPVPAVAPEITTSSDPVLTYGYDNDYVLTISADKPTGHTLSYQWYSCDASGANETAITGETSAEYNFTQGKGIGSYYYYCVVTATRTDNGETATANSRIITVKVEKATPTYNIPSNLTATYGDMLASVSLPNGWSWQDDTQSVGNVGSNKFKANYTTGDPNYESVTDIDVTVTVSAKSIDTPAVTVNGSYKYTGKAIIPDVTVTFAEGDLTKDIDYTLSYGDNTNAGIAYVTVVAKDGGNYDFVGKTEKFTIDPAEVTLSGVTVKDKEYDGNMDAEVENSGLLTGTVNGEKLDYTVTASFKDKNVGTDKQVDLTVELKDGTGVLASNYKLADDYQKTAQADINTRAITITSGISAEERVYAPNDTSVKLVKGTVVFDRKITSDDLDITVSDTGTILTADAGEGKGVSYFAILTGTDAKNYALALPAIRVNITRDTKTISVPNDKSIIKNGIGVDITGWAGITKGDGEITYSLVNALEGVTLSADNKLSADDSVTANSVTIKATVAETTNYQKAEEEFSVKLIDREKQSGFKFAESSLTKTYGNDDFINAATGEAEGSTVTYSSGDPDIATVNEKTGEVHILKAGTVTITAKASATPFYAETEASYVLRIDKRIVNAPAADETVFTYDGQEKTYGIAGSADYTVSGNKQINANEAGYEVTVALKDADNNKWDDGTTADKTYSFIIYKKSITAPAADETVFTYDGTEKTYNIVGTDDYTVSGNTQTAANEDGYTVTVALTDKANTIWADTETDADKTYNFIINKKSITAPTKDETVFTYDGTEKTYEIADSADYTVSGNTKTAANEDGYTVTVELKDKANTIWADTKTDADKTYNFIIKKKPVTAPAADETVFTYDGTEKTYNIAGTDDYTVSGNKKTDANEAGYTVTVVLTDKENTIWADTKTDADKTYDFIINKKSITAPTADETVFTYDGTEKTYNIVGTDDYTVSGNTQTAANEDGYTVTVALKDAANHKWNDGTTADKTFAFKIKKAPVTITVKDKGIRVGGTLPDFSEPKLDEDFAVSGLLGEDKLTTYPTIYFEPEAPDLSVVGEIPIKAKDADAGNNYIINYVDGKLTISRRPSKDKTETTVNSDGSTTKTETKSDGTVVETTTGKDGSTTTVESKTETKSDGTKVETKTETKSDGTTVESKTEVATDKDGAKTETKTEVKTAKDGTKTEVTTEAVTAKDGTKSETTSEVKTDAEGVKSEATTTKITTADGTTGTTKTTVENGEAKTEAEADVSAKAVEAAQKENKVVTVPIEVKATNDSNTATTVNINIEIKSGGQSGSADAVKIEIPVTNAGSGTVAVLVKADGTEEIIKTTVPTESGVEISVEGKATIKIVDNSKSYADTEDHWSKDEVNFVSSRELFNGVGNGNFGVSESMTRGMVNTVLARLAGENTDGGENWYDKGTEWAKQNGVSDGTNPTESVTREQLATMLYRYAGAPEVYGVINFKDADEVSAYAQNALLWAIRNGIVNGVDETHIAPSAQAERAQVAAMMARFLRSYN